MRRLIWRLKDDWRRWRKRVRRSLCRHVWLVADIVPPRMAQECECGAYRVVDLPPSVPGM